VSIAVLYESQIRGIRGIARALGCAVSTTVIYLSQGHNGVRLEAVRIGGVWVSSEEAIERFAAGCTRQHLAATERPSVAPGRRKRQLAETEARLREKGLMT
jgi:hypothetical protein